MCQVHHSQAVVCTLHPHQHPGHDLHLWQGSKFHRKSTPGACGGVPRSQKVPLGLGGGPGEEYSPIRKNWGHDGVETGLRRREQQEGEQR